MGRSFVLKDAAGRPDGYLVQGIQEICCRAGGAARRLQAVLLFDGGVQEEHEADGGQEMRWPCEGRLLCGGYVCADGRLLLSTGEEARRAFMRQALQKRTAQEKRQTGMENPAEPARELEERGEPGHAQQTREWPQRRWPPPPCWPQASYIQGRWQEQP